MKTTLKALQEQFQDYMMGKGEALLEHITSTDKVDNRERMEVYRHGYSHRLIELLEKDFPKLKAMLSESTFISLARAYVHHHPSRYYSARDFGKHFPDFMASQQMDYPHKPWLAELTAFEWALNEVIDTQDAPRLTYDELVQLPPEAWNSLSFQLHPSVIHLSQQYDIPSLWQTLTSPKETPDTICILWRHDNVSYFKQLNPEEGQLFRAILEGMTFPELCEQLISHFEKEEAIPPFIVSNLQKWIIDGWFSGYQLDTSS